MRRALAFLWLAFLGCSPAPWAPRSVPRSWAPPVEVRLEPGFEAAVLPMRGTKNLLDAWNLLHDAMGRTGITPFGPPFYRFLEDPTRADENELRWEVGQGILHGTSVPRPLEIRWFGPQLVVSVRTRGPSEESTRHWRPLVDWIAENGYQPVGEPMMFVNRVKTASGQLAEETELRIPVVKVEVLPLLLRGLVCIAGLSVFVLSLFSPFSRSARRAPLRGGKVWMVLGVCGAAVYLQPLLGDVGYLYGSFPVERGGRWFVAACDAAGTVGAFLPAVMVHLLLRLKQPRLPAAWFFRLAVAALYVVCISPVLVTLDMAPVVLTRVEQGVLGTLRVAAAVLLAVAVLALQRTQPAAPEDPAGSPEPRRAEQIALLTLAGLALFIISCNAILPDAPLREVGSTVLLAIPIPFLLFTAYFHGRSVVFDVVAKRGVLVLGTLLALTTYFAFVPGRLWSARMGWVGSWVFPVSALPFVVLALWLSVWLSARLDRHWLGRALSLAQAQRFFLTGVGGATSEEELLRAAEDRLASIFPLARQSNARRSVHVTLGSTTSAGSAPATSFFEAPVVSHGAHVGTMTISTPPDARPFLSEDQAMFTSLGETLGLALEALQLRERKLAQERAEQELRVLASRAELRALRAQINPHFVFNALNAIAELIASDPQKAESTVERLAEVLRRTLHRSETEWVRVGEELALVRTYLEVEKIRFGQRLDFRVEVRDEAADALVPVMMVQTLVENAVKHGIAPCSNPGRIEVLASRVGDALRIEVRDTGPGFSARSDGNGSGESECGLGLRNIRDRLAGHFGEEASLEIERDQQAGLTVVAVQMPVVSSVPFEIAREAR